MMRMLYRPGLGSIVPISTQETPPADPRGWTPRYPTCGQIRYLADGTPQQYGRVGVSFNGIRRCSVPVGQDPWVPLDPNSTPDGLNRWIDGIQYAYGPGVNPFNGLVMASGWKLSPAGKVEFDRRVKALVDGGGVIYAPLPPGVDQESAVSLSTGPLGSGITDDPVLLRYLIAWTAASQRPHADAYKYVDPDTGTGYNVLPDGLVDPDNGGRAEFLTGQELDDAQQKYGVAGYHWYWMNIYDLASGDPRLFLVQFIKHPSDLMDKLKKLAPTIISVVGGVLAPFTFGITTAAAAVIVAGMQIRQKRLDAEKAKREGNKAADAMAAAVAAQNAGLAKQVDDVYHQYPDMFVSAGYTPDRWATMTLDQKLAVMQLASDGKLTPTPAAQQTIVQSVQQDVNQAIQSVAGQITNAQTAGTYDVYVEGVKAGTGATLNDAASILSKSTKIGDRIEVILNGRSLGLKILTASGTIDVPDDQAAGIRAMARPDLDALLSRASTSAGGGTGGILLALAAAGIVAVKAGGHHR